MFRKKVVEETHIKDIIPMGGGIWVVVPEASETEKILGYDYGKPFEVEAKTLEEAIKKAKEKLKKEVI